MISPDLQSFLESGVSVSVGTRDRDGMPECIRGMGVQVEPGGEVVTVFVAEATGGLTASNARATGRVAVCFGRPRDHKTMQLKGRVLTVERADESARARIDRYRKEHAVELGWIGVPECIVMRLAHWPCFAIRFACEHVFVQTPGPGAGEPLAAGGERSRA